MAQEQQIAIDAIKAAAQAVLDNEAFIRASLADVPSPPPPPQTVTIPAGQWITVALS